MTISRLKKKINVKFGSWHNFARIVGMSVIKGKTPAQIDALASGLKRTAGEEEIPLSKLARLRGALDAFPGGREEFCRKHGFSLVSVHQILQGRRKKMSPTIVRLFSHFGI